MWLWGTFVLGGVCLLLPLAGWALLASRTGDMLASLAATSQVIAILMWAVTWALWRRERARRQPLTRGRRQAGGQPSRRGGRTR